MKKLFSVMAVMLFMSSSLNANAVVADPYACWDVADTTVSAFQEANIKLHHIATYQQEYNVWVAAYDGCMGN
ncbi:MAG: hypothetical protein R2812_01275 [Gelidibacter sp.]